MNSPFFGAFASGFYGLVSSPGGLPPGAIAYADFKNGTYYYGGNSFSDFLIDDPDFWGTIAPSTLVPGSGFVNTGPSSSNPATAASLAAAITENGGCTLVSRFVAGSDPMFKFQMTDKPDMAQMLTAQLTTSGASPLIGDYNSITPITAITPDELVSCAITLSSTKIAVSINGGSVVTYSVTDPFVCNYLGFYVLEITWQQVVFYPIKLDADLPALSA